ncbi:MAG: 30S ribosomal protein S2 [Methanosarcinales archaeon]|nr:MAG: 30S ribosomal protein S2 [Methanosarcinales archaeon]
MNRLDEQNNGQNEEVTYESIIPLDEYLAAGIHIGTQQKTGDMMRFIYRVRSDGLYVLNVENTDRRIRAASDLLTRYPPQNILAVSARQYGQRPAGMFAKLVGATAITGRFVPGTLTNPQYASYIEPDILLVTDPIGDAQAATEAVSVGIPVIGLCDTNNSTTNVDLVIPTNNKGRKALAMVYWLLAKQIVAAHDKMEFSQTVEDFEAEL